MCTKRGSACIVLGENCQNMRMLFQHSKKCKKDDCKIEDCMISRVVLSHFTNCQDLDCRFCKPVRVALLRKESKDRGNISYRFYYYYY